MFVCVCVLAMLASSNATLSSLLGGGSSGSSGNSRGNELGFYRTRTRELSQFHYFIIGNSNGGTRVIKIIHINGRLIRWIGEQ